ncbi:MAG: hypothetical protein K0R46_568 [Herbinix sp.]|nr:hypothetical protein [Herbinix sp.]
MSSILIVGSYCTFINELIRKFYKENWRIYTLTSNKTRIKPMHVFEQYQFRYDSDSVKEIINSCRPDTVLFSGAYDTLNQWEEDKEITESLHFITGLSNLLMSCAVLEVKHFVYISSDKVYEDKYIVDIKEEMQVSPHSFQGMTISQGENLAMHYERTTRMEVTIARIAQMYGIPMNREDCTDLFSEMCVKALVTGRLKVNAKKVLSALFVKDAIEALYLLIKAPERKHPLYHISSVEEVTEEAIARLIQENYTHPIEIVDQTIGLKYRVVLSNERFCEEFPFQVKNSYQDMIPQMITYINGHKNLFLYEDEKQERIQSGYRVLRLFRKAVPFLESIAFFIPFFMLNNRAVGSTYFNGVNFYLLYVLLFAVVHGRQQAIFSSLLSVIGYCFRQLYTSSGFYLLININTYIWIAQLFVVGLTVGQLKDSFREMEVDKNEKIDFLSERMSDITVINYSNTKIKNYYAEKLISSTESIGRIYEITSKLEKGDTGEVLFAALDTLSEIMEVHDISIYLVSDLEYCRLVSASSERARALGKSILMKNYRMIFDVLTGKQVYINRSLERNLPMMAGALFDDQNNMRIIILLWDIPYEQMTLYQANLLTIVGALIYSAVVKDANYLDALAYRRYLPDTTILMEAAFMRLVDTYKKAEKKGYAESCMCFVRCESLSLKEIDDRIHQVLRKTDYVGAMNDGSLAVLLTNTNEQEAIFVRERLEERSIQTYIGKVI